MLLIAREGRRTEKVSRTSHCRYAACRRRRRRRRRRKSHRVSSPARTAAHSSVVTPRLHQLLEYRHEISRPALPSLRLPPRRRRTHHRKIPRAPATTAAPTLTWLALSAPLMKPIADTTRPRKRASEGGRRVTTALLLLFLFTSHLRAPTSVRHEWKSAAYASQLPQTLPDLTDTILYYKTCFEGSKISVVKANDTEKCYCIFAIKE